MDKLQKSIKVIGMGILIFLIHFLIFIRFFILGSLSLMVLMVLFVIQPDTTLYDISLIAKSEAFILLAGLFAMVMLGINLISKGGIVGKSALENACCAPSKFINTKNSNPGHN